MQKAKKRKKQAARGNHRETGAAAGIEAVAQAGAAASTSPRIARVAKGKKPQYFADPATDKLLWITITLMEELSVTRDRLDTVERLLNRKRLLRTAEIEHFEPAGRDAQERDARRSAYVERVMRAVQAELESLTRHGKPDEDEAVAAVSA